MYKTSFRVVQLMYRPIQGYEQSVPKVLVGVQTCPLDHYTSSGVFNVRDKVECCTVDVQAPTGFKQSVPNLVVCVQNFRLEHYTSCSLGSVHDKFQGCTVDVQAATEFLTIST